jgi:hypothetical protein
MKYNPLKYTHKNHEWYRLCDTAFLRILLTLAGKFYSLKDLGKELKNLSQSDCEKADSILWEIEDQTVPNYYIKLK